MSRRELLRALRAETADTWPLNFSVVHSTEHGELADTVMGLSRRLTLQARAREHRLESPFLLHVVFFVPGRRRSGSAYKNGVKCTKRGFSGRAGSRRKGLTSVRLRRLLP